MRIYFFNHQNSDRLTESLAYRDKPFTISSHVMWINWTDWTMLSMLGCLALCGKMPMAVVTVQRAPP